METISEMLHMEAIFCMENSNSLCGYLQILEGKWLAWKALLFQILWLRLSVSSSRLWSLLASPYGLLLLSSAKLLAASRLTMLSPASLTMVRSLANEPSINCPFFAAKKLWSLSQLWWTQLLMQNLHYRDNNTDGEDMKDVTVTVILFSSTLYYITWSNTTENYTILYYTILYYTILYYTILYYTVLYFHTILYNTIPYNTIL